MVISDYASFKEMMTHGFAKDAKEAERILKDTRDGYKVLLKYLAKEDEVQGRRKEVEE